jgi:hypothetical protein
VIAVAGRPAYDEAALKLADQISQVARTAGSLDVVPYPQTLPLDPGGLRSAGTTLGVDFILRVQVNESAGSPVAEFHVVTPQRPSLPVWIAQHPLPSDAEGFIELCRKVAEQAVRAASTAQR